MSAGTQIRVHTELFETGSIFSINVWILKNFPVQIEIEEFFGLFVFINSWIIKFFEIQK